MPAEARIGAEVHAELGQHHRSTATAPTTNELIERSTEPIVRARWAAPAETGAAVPPELRARPAADQPGDPAAVGTLDDPVDGPVQEVAGDQREHDDEGDRERLATMTSADAGDHVGPLVNRS